MYIYIYIYIYIYKYIYIYMWRLLICLVQRKMKDIRPSRISELPHRGYVAPASGYAAASGYVAADDM